MHQSTQFDLQFSLERNEWETACSDDCNKASHPCVPALCHGFGCFCEDMESISPLLGFWAGLVTRIACRDCVNSVQHNVVKVM